jgi:2-iminobutanoate/2-iminopropanoate deaminase
MQKKDGVMKEFRNPPDVHQPVGSYTHQIEIRGGERLLVISGQVGVRADGTVPADPIEQVDLALENILRNLRAANMDLRDIIKLNYYLVGEMDATRRREVLAARLQGHQPCSTLVYVAALADPMFRVEIEAWASRADD